MRTLLGLGLALALALTALVAAPATANNDKASDVGQNVLGCGWCYGGVCGFTEDTLNRWKGDTSYLTCKFRDLVMDDWDEVKYAEGTGSCWIAANPAPPYQPWVYTSDWTWHVNAEGNATLRCVGPVSS